MVANETQRRYGIFMKLTHRAYGYIAMSAHTSVPSTKKISIIARKLFCNPNCIGEKRRLNMRFKINGTSTNLGILLVIPRYKTYAYEIAISTYSTVQTGPNSHAGGAHAGVISASYHVAVFSIPIFYKKTLTLAATTPQSAVPQIISTATNLTVHAESVAKLVRS